MKRILVLADLHANKLGSMEEFDMFLARELVRRGRQCFLGFIAEPDPAIKKMLEDAGARIACIFNGETVGGGHISRMTALYRFIRENHIDLVHINFYSLTNPCLLGVYVSGAKIVFTDHTSGSAPSRGKLKHLFSRALHFTLARRISKYVAVSDFVHGRLAASHHVGPEKTVTLYNGVNLARFAPRDQALARVGTGLPRGAKVVVAVAMLIPDKGIHHLIEAAAILVREFGVTDLCVAIVGEGQYRDSLERMADDLGVTGHVRFMGRRSDVDVLVAASDVVAVPSLWAEAFGFIIAEAMAAGRPVVASRIGGIPELVEDRKTGLLVEPGDSLGLAAGIGELLRDPRLGARLAENALEQTRREFDVERQASRYADLFEEVMR